MSKLPRSPPRQPAMCFGLARSSRHLFPTRRPRTVAVANRHRFAVEVEHLALAVAAGAELDDHHRGRAELRRAVHCVRLAGHRRVDKVVEVGQRRVLDFADFDVLVS